MKGLRLLGDEAWARKYAGLTAIGLPSLVRSFLDHYAIVLYIFIALGSLVAFWAYAFDWVVLLLAIMISAILFSPVEYALHRYVLHATFLSRTPWTAGLWRRLHFDHHMEPADFSVLFAAPSTSIPFLITLSVAGALAIDRPGMFPAMLCATTVAFLYYEFMHLVAHTPMRTNVGWLLRRRRFHLQHHYLDERVQFGIGAELIDRLASSRVDPELGSRSDTVRNLGYAGETAERFPWVRESYARKLEARRGGETAA